MPPPRGLRRALPPVLWAAGLAVGDLEGYGVDVLGAEVDVVEAPGPAVGHGHLVDLVEVEQDPLLELPLAGHADAPGHLARELAEEGLHEVEP